jgi:6-phosphogluconolactonase
MRSLFICLQLVISITTFCQKSFLFVGTYTSTGSKGIYVYQFDGSTGNAELLSTTENIANPSFLAIAPNKKFIYACTDTRTPTAGSVSAFSFNKKTGKLRFVNKEVSSGFNPVYTSIHKSNKWLVAGNYTGGNITVFPINKDGSIKAYSQSIQHTGKSINPERQEKSHVHCTVFSPDYKYVYVPDLGIDKVMTYAVQENETTPLVTVSPPFAASVQGSGPRHITFHPNKKYAYLIEEMSGAVVAYNYNNSNGKLDSIQRIFTHPGDAIGPFGGADIHVSPDGGFLYASNRASENNLAIFSIDANTGKLKTAGYQSALGKTPRNFTIDPTGNFVLVANQESDNVVVFKRDVQTGLLTPTGIEIKVPQPSCLQMMKQ